MLSDSAIAALREIRHHIELAEDFTKAMKFDAFRDDTRVVYAVARCLEIISDASRRLPQALNSQYQSVDWRAITGAATVCSQEYEDVSARMLWDTVQVGLPPLLDVVTRELRNDVASRAST